MIVLAWDGPRCSPDDSPEAGPVADLEDQPAGQPATTLITKLNSATPARKQLPLQIPCK
ncbi:MAG: hypothetical protein QOH84_601 [Kribbellaceae bacterium]|nr:hypothetical protein [Kribbellaceae bacterium]